MTMIAPPPPPMPAPTWPKIGTWNHLEATIGQRGMGKSVHQCLRALELTREAGGAYVIGHSIGARLPTRLPDSLGGDALPITYHRTMERLASGLRRHPDRWHILAPPISGDGTKVREGEPPSTADDLLRYSLALSTALRKGAWQRAHPLKFWTPTVNYEGIPCPPVIVIIDEGIAIESATTNRKDKNTWFLSYLYSLRHNHIALLYAIQDPSARSWRIIEQANVIYVFGVRHSWALEFIRAAGATQDELEQIRALQKYQYVTLDWENRPRPTMKAPAESSEET